MSRAIIFGDWGTSRLRLFLAQGDAIIDRSDGPGIGTIGSPPLEILRTAVAAWTAQHRIAHIALCGMVGSRNGLVEVPYAACPVDAAEWVVQRLSIQVDGIDVAIAPGLECRNPIGAPDVMRGEETQIFGAVALDPRLGAGRHLLVLPGTHSKWVEIEDGRVLRFHTYLTGELFALMRDHSTLTRAGGGDSDRDGGFTAGLARVGGGVVGTLFEARSAQLLLDRTRGWALGFLSGLLIGEEIAEARGHFGVVDSVTMIGDPVLTASYRRAFADAGIAALDMDGNACSLAGLRHLLAAIEEPA